MDERVDLVDLVEAVLVGVTVRTAVSLSAGESPGDSAVPSHGVPSVSFVVPIEDQMSIEASGDGQSFSDDEDSAGLPPSGVASAAESDPELTAVLSRAAARSGWRHAHLPVPSPAARCLAPRHRPWLVTTPYPGSFLPGSARGADEVVDGPFLRPEAAHLPPPSSLPSMVGG